MLVVSVVIVAVVMIIFPDIVAEVVDAIPDIELWLWTQFDRLPVPESSRWQRQRDKLASRRIHNKELTLKPAY